ncbi:aldehyde dehydrogenase family protein [Agromyces sp. SYSU T00194]|uniref:aldehyde dehydrogenase family protein n=1 Tax=Agromyces chitinivorans TaxID=3158560 RepID=UPI0033989AFC
MTQARPVYLAGEWETSEQTVVSREPGSGAEIGAVHLATAEQLDRATAAAVAAFEQTRRMASYERSDALHRIADGLRDRREEFGRMLAREAGKPLADSLVEVDRTVFAFRHAAEEAVRIQGEVLPLDVIPSARGKWAITRRMPLGPVAGISPFNVPLSLSAHKLAPAIAAGDSIVLKPDTRVAGTLLMLAEVIDDAGLPAGAVSVLPMDVAVADAMVTDPRFALLSFTGSARVGWDMRARAGSKHVVLELGGDGAVVVAPDADLDRVMGRLLVGGFKYAGQICISVQRVLVHASRIDELRERLVEGARGLRVGDPLEDGVDLGPMISEDAAMRAVGLVEEAVASGADLLTGGTRDRAYVRPAVLEHVPPTVRLAREEAFAPIVTLESFERMQEAWDAVNASAYGLQAGVFTDDLPTIWEAFEELRVGGVIVNDVPTFRVDHMPYGGMKESGVGREGIRYAIEHMTELRTLVVNTDRPAR